MSDLPSGGRVGKVPTIMKTSKTRNPKPEAGTVLLQACVPAVIGGLFWYKGHLIPAAVLAGIALVVLVSGFLVPRVFAVIERFGRWLGHVVGTALTWILLVPMFYLVFVPGRLILKLRGIDPMCRQFPTDAPTYWVSRKPVNSVEDYKRQY